MPTALLLDCAKVDCVPRHSERTLLCALVRSHTGVLLGAGSTAISWPSSEWAGKGGCTARSARTIWASTSASPASDFARD